MLKERIPVFHHLFPKLIQRVYVLKMGKLMHLSHLKLHRMSIILHQILPLHISNDLLQIKILISNIIHLLLLLIKSVSVLPRNLF